MDEDGTTERAVRQSGNRHDSRTVSCPRAWSWDLQEITGEVRASYLEHPREGGSPKLGIVLQWVVALATLAGRLGPIV